MNRPTRLGALLIACVACAHGPAGPSGSGGPLSAGEGGSSAPPTISPAPPTASATDAAARLASIRTAVDALLTAQAKLLWEAWTRGAAPDLESSLAGHDALFSRETLAFVKGARDAAAGDERRALALLHGFLAGEQLSRQADSGAAAQPAVLDWDGKSLPASQVPGRLAGEPDPVRRAALERAWLAAARRGGAAEAGFWQRVAETARLMGYDTLLALAAELRGEPIDALAALAEGVLGATDAAYRALLETLARVEMEKDLAALRGRDLPWLLGAGEDARAFPGGRASVDVGETLVALGLDLGRRPGVLLDLEPRPGKNPRALALPVEVPGDVRVSFAPQGGPAELRALLHEMGAAMFYAHVAARPLEFRRLGAVTPEAWAYLFEDLAGDPGWLTERTDLDENHVAPLVRAAAARRLHGARTLAARILIEIARARDPARAQTAARAILETAFARGVEAEELELFLLDRDPLLASADSLRALLLAAQAEAFLANRSASPWWRSKENGEWLAKAFAEGSRLAPSELARSFGSAGVDASALATSSRARAAAAGIRLAQAVQR